MTPGESHLVISEVIEKGLELARSPSLESGLYHGVRARFAVQWDMEDNPGKHHAGLYGSNLARRGLQEHNISKFPK
jgi:hypothetical protein